MAGRSWSSSLGDDIPLGLVGMQHSSWLVSALLGQRGIAFDKVELHLFLKLSRDFFFFFKL